MSEGARKAGTTSESLSCIHDGLVKFDIAVIIPARNEAAFIGKCVESIIALAGEERCQVLVVDNGSDDETAAVADAAGAQVVAVATGTVAHLRNVGAAHACAPVLAFVDADCTVEQGWMHSALCAFDNTRTVAIGCYPRLPDAGTTWVQRTWITMVRRPAGPASATAWLPSANMVVRASTFCEVGGFDENMVTSEDADLSFRPGQHGQVMYDDDVAAIHYRE